MHKDIFYIGL